MANKSTYARILNWKNLRANLKQSSKSQAADLIQESLVFCIKAINEVLLQITLSFPVRDETFVVAGKKRLRSLVL